MSNGHTDRLFEGILESARSEARSIVERAERDAALTSATYQKKIADAAEQERRATENRLAQIKRLEESAIRNLERRHEVTYSQRLRQFVLDEVATRMTALVGTERYRNALVGWIAEAAIGLDKEAAVVRCSFRETVDEPMLRESERLIRQAYGKQVSLRFGGAVLSGQGIEVTSNDGKVAYNNQVATRLIRKERQLKELMEGAPCHKG